MSERDVGAARTPGPLLVLGRYRLIAVVGAGGMGRVWRAHDEVLDRQVAVKELVAPRGLPVPDRRTAALRAMSEARAAARLEHPGVVRVYDVVRTTGSSWIVMEFVESVSLHARLEQEGRLEHPEAARIGLAVLDALGAAHRAGVVHRDVKPHNILLATDDRVMLTDFGLAALDTERVDGALSVLGSPYYVAPEQLTDGTASVEGDLWSLGATLYAMVEGRPPFRRANVAASLTAIAGAQPDPMRHEGPLSPLIGLLLEKDPDLRPPVAEVQVALRLVAEEPVPVRFRAAAVAPAGSIAEPGEQSQAVPSPPRRRRVLVAAAAAVVVVAGTGAAMAFRPEGPEGPTPQRATAAAPTGPCADFSPEPSAAPGIEIRVPAGWTRSQKDGETCYRAPNGVRAATVQPIKPLAVGPLEHWQAAERAASDAGELPGYRRISMGVLLVTGGGADWEYTWQPPAGARRHAHRYLVQAGGRRPIEVSWTTSDADWAAATAVERAIVSSVRTPGQAAPTWSVPSPQ
ncbi:protein kinase [Actinoplanes sp. NPDC051470]|uniref:serine/threonine-protein kinase n=1 Tax=Actinoplanes sp. NPDC051470 TaxID=3157224 RepID=UPI00341FDFC8